VRILLINNHHRAQPGGAETVVLATKSLLRDAGHDVQVFSLLENGTPPGPYDDVLPRLEHLQQSPLRLSGSIATPYSTAIAARLRDVLRRFRPHIAHLHNVYAKLTWSVVDALHVARVPVVCTVHDYRLVCPNGRLYRDGEPCSNCLSSSLWAAVRQSCMEGGRLPSLIAAAELWVSRQRRHAQKIQCFICPSEYARSVLVTGGISTSRTVVVRNPAPNDASIGRALEWPPRFVFAGRFVAEKGVMDIVTAAQALPQEFRVELLGAGRAEAAVRQAVATSGASVAVLSSVPQHGVGRVLRGATGALVPSRWPENAPMAIVEAAVQCVPTIATNVGGIPELVKDGRNGLLVAPGDPQALARSMIRLANDPVLARTLGRAARRRALRDHDPAHYVEQLESVYLVARARCLPRQSSPRPIDHND
jgi:glycosyltransferase involved in cell wall biosynthesis